MLNNLHMGFKLERLYDGCRYLAEAGFKGKSDPELFAELPEETEEQPASERRVLDKKGRVNSGRRCVFPLMFFLGIQPIRIWNTGLLEEGYLSAGYNPLMLTPTSIRKLLYATRPPTNSS